MNFGKVLESMKIDARNRFTRAGWNGKGMYIYLTKGRDIPVEKWTGSGDPAVRNGMVTIGSHIDMVDANGNVVVGWLASQTDMLAEDWEKYTAHEMPLEEKIYPQDDEVTEVWEKVE